MDTSADTARRGWYHGWNIVAVCALSQAAANGLPLNAFSLFLLDWSTQLHSPISSMQLGIAAMSFFTAFCSPFVGVLADKHSARWLMGSGLLGIAAFHLGVSFVTTSSQLLILYALLLPVAVAFSTALPANAVVSRWFVRRLGMALGLTAFGLGVAGVILPPIVATLVPRFGWRAIWRVSGLAIAFIVTPLVMWVLRDNPSERDGFHYVAVEGKGRTQIGHGRGKNHEGPSWREVFARRNFWVLVVVYLPMLALYGGCSTNLAPIAISRGLSSQTSSVLLSIFSLSYVSAALLAGIFSDRFGNRLTLFGLAMATGVGGMLVAFGRDEVSLGAGVMLVGLSGGMFPVLAAACAAEFGATGVGRTFGLLMMFLPVIALTPFIVAKLRESTGSYVPGLLGLAILSFAGGVACLLLMQEIHARVPGALSKPTTPINQ